MKAPSRGAARGVSRQMQALEYANRVRVARAALKQGVRAGEVKVAEVIRECPWEAETMTVLELLRSQHSWGYTRSRNLLVSLPLNENWRVGRLTERQRLVLGSELERSSREG